MTARKGGEMHSELAEYLHVAGRLKLLKKTWKTCDFARASLQSARDAGAAPSPWGCLRASLISVGPRRASPPRATWRAQQCASNSPRRRYFSQTSPSRQSGVADHRPAPTADGCHTLRREG